MWLADSGSEHGLKLKPTVGEMIASAVVSGKEVPKMFQLERLRDAEKRRTQFDAKDKS